jgi:hypothetical protein
MCSIEPTLQATLNGSEKLVKSMLPSPLRGVGGERGEQRCRLEAAAPCCSHYRVVICSIAEERLQARREGRCIKAGLPVYRRIVA